MGDATPAKDAEPTEKELTEDKKNKSDEVTNAIDDLIKTAESNPKAISELKKKIEELKKKRTEEEEADKKIEKQLNKNAKLREQSAAEANAITKAYSSKARTELLVDPTEIAFEKSFHQALREDQYLLHNLVDLDWQLNSKFIEWKKAYRHYSVFSTVLTLIIIMCTSLVVVFEVMEQSGGIGKDEAAVIVAFLAFVATVMTGWLSYSKAEGKAALLGENQKTVRALQTRVRVLTKHHIPGTISLGNAAIEIDRIKQEQMRVQENVALIYNFQDWGTYSCCFKKCCERKCKKHSEDNSSTDEPSKEARNMKQWFKKMYYDSDYQEITIDYFDKILNDPDRRRSGDSSKWTGDQKKGGIKKSTGKKKQEQEADLELAEGVRSAAQEEAGTAGTAKL